MLLDVQISLLFVKMQKLTTALESLEAASITKWRPRKPQHKAVVRCHHTQLLITAVGFSFSTPWWNSITKFNNELWGSGHLTFTIQKSFQQSEAHPRGNLIHPKVQSVNVCPGVTSWCCPPLSVLLPLTASSAGAQWSPLPSYQGSLRGWFRWNASLWGS